MKTGQALAQRKRAAIADTYRDPTAAATLASLEIAMGGRPALIAALLHNPADADLSYVVGLIASPANDARHLADICADGGVAVGELIEAYKRGVFAQAQIAAIRHVGDNLAAVTEDVMVRARPHWQQCEACTGTGTFVPEPTDKTPNPTPGPCDQCTGLGHTLVRPDLDRQKLALELGGLGPKKAPLVDLSDRRKLSVNTGTQDLVGLIGAVDQLLHRRERPTALSVVSPVSPIDAVAVEADTDAADAPAD